MPEITHDKQFRALLEAVPDATLIVARDGRILLANEATARLLGYRCAEELHGMPVEQLVPLDRRESHLRPHLVARRRDGSELEVATSLHPLDGELVCAVVRDIGETGLAETRQMLAAIVDTTDDAVIAKTPQGIITQWNAGAERLYGWSAEEAVGQPIALIFPPEVRGEEQEILRRIISGSRVDHYETVRVRKDGVRVHVSLTVSPVLDAGGRVVGASAIARDISERKRLEGQLQYLAEHDPLTGMYNRWRFERELTRELAVARRYGGGGALLAIDLDHFKFVNDSLGHVAGDELIRRSASVVRSRLRDTDILARMGGDEFAVILRASGPGEAESVAADLVSALREEVQLEMAAGVQRITASVGIAPFPGPEPLSAEDLLVEADIAMYDAKEAGRDCARLYDAGQQRHRLMHARLTWVERIRRALADERFVLHAQPIVALEGGGPARYELLLRMIGDDGELVPPGTFLEVAERFELIQAIDRWVLTQGCALLAERQRCGDDVRLAINVSAKSATDPGMAAAIATELAGAGARADGLCIELTETDAIINVDRAKEFALQLGKLGCEFALDDFGAGFASFYYLKHLAYDLLKIDGEFVSGLSDTHANRLIVEAIVGIARGMGRRTVAECVADAETLESLRGTGVDFVQGYHLAEPAPLERFGLIAATH